MKCWVWVENKNEQCQEKHEQYSTVEAVLNYERDQQRIQQCQLNSLVVVFCIYSSCYVTLHQKHY